MNSGKNEFVGTDDSAIVNEEEGEGRTLSEEELLELFDWENVYRKIIGIYRNFDGKLLNSCLATVSEVFLVLIAPIPLFLFLFISNLKYLLDWNC